MSIWAGDCEYPSFWREGTMRARKEHKCSACFERILPGHSYKKIVTLFDGEIDTVKRCRRCEAMYQELNARMQERNKTRDGWDHEFPDAELDCGHSFEEVWGQVPPIEVAELAFLLPGEEPGALLSGGGK